MQAMHFLLHCAAFNYLDFVNLLHLKYYEMCHILIRVVHIELVLSRL